MHVHEGVFAHRSVPGGELPTIGAVSNSSPALLPSTLYDTLTAAPTSWRLSASDGSKKLGEVGVEEEEKKEP